MLIAVWFMIRRCDPRVSSSQACFCCDKVNCSQIKKLKGLNKLMCLLHCIAVCNFNNLFVR